MRVIEIAALSNGAHRNQTGLDVLPGGWAVIPDDMACENFPFGEVTVEEIDGAPTVTGWAPGTMSEPEPAPEPAPEPETPTDLEARVAALEADAAQAVMDRAALTLLLTGEDTEVTT